MSIYASFLDIGDEDHDQECAQHVPAKPTDKYVSIWIDGTHTTRDETKPCTCSALGAPYVYLGSHRSITGPDHPRSRDDVHMARAVGTWTLRLGIGSKIVLLDRRQVELMRDALIEFLEFWDDPDDYHRADAFDAALPTEDQLEVRAERTAAFDLLVVKLKAEGA